MATGNRYTVVRAVPLPKDDEHSKWSPPPRFPLIIDTQTMTLCEPAAAFLFDCRIDVQYPAQFSDAVIGEAHDLRDFLEFLDYQNLAISDIEEKHIEKYRDVFSVTRSPKTYESYKTNTVKRRVATALAFCNYLIRSGLLKRPENSSFGKRLSKNRSRASQSTDISEHSLAVEVKRKEQDRVRVISKEHLQRILDTVGPLPKLDWKSNENPHTRNRLICEIALHTGMRRNEITHLTSNQIKHLEMMCKGKTLTQAVYLQLHRTKGQQPGNVRFPVWLVQLLAWYVHNERSSRSGHSNQIDHGRLFTNFAAHRNAGAPITNDSISEMFHDAVIKSGLFRTSFRQEINIISNIDRSTTREFTGGLYVFHDLRHTFALRMYRALSSTFDKKEETLNAPWKVLQRLLRHKHLSTTLDTYLSIAENVHLENQIDDAISLSLAHTAKKYG